MQSRQGRDDEPGRAPKRISWLARDGWPLADDRVKQVKEANDIVAVIEGYLELRPAGGARFKGLCPFHDDHNPSLLVDQQWQNYKCWSCNKYGDVITFVQDGGFPFELMTLVSSRENMLKVIGYGLYFSR